MQFDKFSNTNNIKYILIQCEVAISFSDYILLVLGIGESSLV